MGFVFLAIPDKYDLSNIKQATDKKMSINSTLQFNFDLIEEENNT